MRFRTAIVVALFAGVSALLLAHEGHNAEPGRPNYVEVDLGGAAYRVGLAWLPPEPVVGEDVRFEVQFAELRPASAPAGRDARPLAGAPVRLRVAAADQSSTESHELPPANASGISRTSLRFDGSGAYVVSVSAETGRGPLSATYTVAVASGPLGPATLVVDAVVLAAFFALGLAWWRRTNADDRPGLPGRVAVAAAGVAALAGAHLIAGPALGRALLPDRPNVAVVWDAPPAAAAAAAPSAAPALPGGPPSPASTGGSALDAADVAATVVPAPGAIAEVVVPVTSRVTLQDGVRLGATVQRGATLATLEHHYILHDAVHLINTRWPLLNDTLRTRRDMHAAELLAIRLGALQQKGTVPAWAVQVAQGQAATARIEYARAQKLLAMHDAQIRQQNLVRRPLQAPISGTIDSVSLVQGQLAYENDKLFTIVDLSNLWVELRVPERLSGAWRPSKGLTFVSPSAPEVRLEGTLARVANQVDPVSRTIAYYFRVGNPGKRLRVGMRLSPVLEERAGTGGRSDVAPAAFDPSGSESGASRAVRVAGIVRPKPELIAQATAPIWGRIEFKDRTLNVGDAVRKDQVLANVILELSIDERYLMEARAAEILAELDLSKLREVQAEQQHQEALARAKAAPDDAITREEVRVTEEALKSARQERALLERQKTTYDGTMKRRDPRITPVPAPISGVITEVAFRPGELNATGEFRRLFTIVDTSRVWVEAQVFEHQGPMVLTRLKRATFAPASGGPEIPLGRPVSVSATVDERTRTVRVIFEAANPADRLKLGGSGQVTLEWN